MHIYINKFQFALMSYTCKCYFITILLHGNVLYFACRSRNSGRKKYITASVHVIFLRFVDGINHELKL